jgi:hypothetical protein
MMKFKIEKLAAINNCILLVFYTPGTAWQFRVISSSGEIFGEQHLYYTSEAAERAGRTWLVERSK